MTKKLGLILIGICLCFPGLGMDPCVDFLKKHLHENDLIGITSPAKVETVIELQTANSQSFSQGVETLKRRSSKIFDWLRGTPAPKHWSGSRGALRKTKALAQDFAIPLTKFLLPIPSLRKWGRGPTYKIFHKLWKNPRYGLTLSEIDTLKKFKNYHYYLRLRRTYMDHPRLFALRKSLHYAAETARVTTLSAAGFYLYYQARSGLPSLKEFLNHKKYALKDTQVQLIIDMVPFPHMAIRIEDWVYSYGQQHLTVSHVSRYLNHRKYVSTLQEANKRDGVVKKVSKSKKDIGFTERFSNSLGKIGGMVAQLTGLNKLPHSVQIVTLNLKLSEVDQLKRHLVSHTGKRYANTTFVNDCVTMIFRAMKLKTSIRIGRLLDASPSQTGLYFAMRKFAGDKRVGPIYQVATQQVDRPLKHLMRNTYINILESFIFIKYFYLNQGQRLIIDAYFSADTIQKWDKESLEHWKEWKKEVEKTVRSNWQIKVLRIQVKSLYTKKRSIKEVKDYKKFCSKRIEKILKEYIKNSQKIIDSNHTDFMKRVKNEYFVAIYKKKLKAWKRKITMAPNSWP